MQEGIFQEIYQVKNQYTHGIFVRFVIIKKREKNANESKLGSVAGPAIQANGSLSFEEDFRSEDLVRCVSQKE